MRQKRFLSPSGVGKVEPGPHVAEVVIRLRVDRVVREAAVRRRNCDVVGVARNLALVELEDLARVAQVDHRRVEVVQRQRILDQVTPAG